MANQAIALQARAPQSSGLGGAIQQNAMLINQMAQQQAAQRQAAAQQQQAQIAQAQEARAAALARPQLAKAESEATTEQAKAVSAFLDLSIEGMMQARSPEQAARVGEFLKQQFPDSWARQAVDETLSTMPSDPAQFEPWRKQTLFQSMDAKDQLSQKFEQMTTGAETWMTATPEYAGAPQGLEATEVAGTRVQAPQGIQYVKAADGSIIPVPKEMPGASPGLVGGSRGGGGGHPALATNPGALKDSAFTRAQPGYVGTKGSFAVFDTPEAGIAAQEKLLRDSYVGRGFNTISKIVNRYAPQGPENSAASVRNYQQYVAQRTGLDINAPIPSNKIPVLAAAMREFETGQRPGGGVQMGQPIPGTGKTERAATEAYGAMDNVVAKYDDTIARARKLLRNPALNSIVGNIQGNVPEAVLSALSQDAADALADYNELLSVAGFQELQAMRDASPTGGALGQVSDSENRLLQQSAFASARTQSEPKFRRSLQDYIARLEASKRRVEAAYQRQYGQSFSAPRRGATPRPQGTRAPAGRRTAGGATVSDW